MKEQPYSAQILNDPSVQHTGAHFTFLNRIQPNEKKSTGKFWIQEKQLIPLSFQKKNCKQNSSKSTLVTAFEIYQDGEKK